MTLAALSPLFIWWPLALAVAFLIARTAGRVGRQQRFPWPPPVVLTITHKDLRYWFDDWDPWGTPDPSTRVA